MDTKKNLKPELKEIYERVMNTPSSTRSTPVPPANPTPVITPPEKKTDDVSTPPAPTPPSNSPASEPFLTSSAPRAINDTSGFVFSSHGKTMPKQDDKPKKKEEKVEVKKEEVHIEESKKTT